MSLKSEYSKYLNNFNKLCKGVDALTSEIENYKKSYYPEQRFPEHRFKATKSGKYEIVY